MADGVEVLLDQYDLKEGQDTNSFMERMVTDPSVTHVLIICDRAYAEKADKRESGVGTESQIISQEVYKKVEQSKFIPVICETSENGEPFLPTFVKSRKWVNFSSLELVNSNWEQLIRAVYGKPLFQKPALGTAPSYIKQDDRRPVSPAFAKFEVLKNALHQGRTGSGYRNDFLEACYEYIDSLRIRTTPQDAHFGQKVLDLSDLLHPVRDLIIDWVNCEVTLSENLNFEEPLIQMLEKLLELKARPQDATNWDNNWSEAHRLFAYQVFLYVTAALLRLGRHSTIGEQFSTHYLTMNGDMSQSKFNTFDVFYAHSDTLNSVLAAPGKNLLSPAAALIRRQANREDITFDSIMEADLLCLMAASLKEKAIWYPQTLYYWNYGNKFPFFIRSTQRKHFRKLAEITGIADGNGLRDAVKRGFDRMGVHQWSDFRFYSDISFWNALNMDKLDTLS